MSHHYFSLIAIAVTVFALSDTALLSGQAPTTPASPAASDSSAHGNDQSIDDPYADDDSAELGVKVGSCPGEAVCVTDTMIGSPAEAADIRSGDYILMIDGAKVTSPAELKRTIANHQPGEKVTIILWRRGRELTKEIDLALESEEIPPANRAWLGVSLMPARERGVSVDQVVSGGPAAQVGLLSGDVISAVNGQEVKGVDGFMRRLGEFEPGNKVRLLIDRNGVQHNIDAKLGSVEEAPLSFLRRAYRRQLGSRPRGYPMGMPMVGFDPIMDEAIDDLRRQIRELRNQVQELKGRQDDLGSEQLSEDSQRQSPNDP